MKIYAPVKDTNGIYASVRFVNGVGETNNPALIEWFRKHGYRLETIEKSVEKSEVSIEKSVEKCAEPDLDSMTSDEIRTWAKENGLGGVIKNTRNKEKLLELIRG
jgi:hypothetical protein